MRCKGAIVLALYKRAGSDVIKILLWQTLTTIDTFTETSRSVRA